MFRLVNLEIDSLEDEVDHQQDVEKNDCTFVADYVAEKFQTQNNIDVSLIEAVLMNIQKMKKVISLPIMHPKKM